MTMCESKLTDKQEKNGKIHIEIKHTVTFMPYHISVVPLTPINYTESIQTNALTEIEWNPFFSIEQPNITIIPMLQKLDSGTPDKFMAILWNPGDHSKTIKRI